MSPAFSHCFLKRLSAFSKLSSGSTITLVTRSSPLSFLPEALPVYHAPIGLATHAPLGVPRAQFLHPHSLSRAGRGGVPTPDHSESPTPWPLGRTTKPRSSLRQHAEDKGPE